MTIQAEFVGHVTRPIPSIKARIVVFEAGSEVVRGTVEAVLGRDSVLDEYSDDLIAWLYSDSLDVARERADAIRDAVERSKP